VSDLAPLAHSLRLDVLVQLLLAILLGGAIGLERELQGKPAGLRTNILICLGATLFTLLSYRLAGGGADAGRVAAQVVTGIGFLGAGSILHARGSIVGLTSAATIWLVAAIGMAIGCHAYIEGLGTTLLTLVILAGLVPIEKAVEARTHTSHLVLYLRPEPGTVESIERLIRCAGLRMEAGHLRKEAAEVVLETDIIGPRRLHDETRLALLENAAVASVSMTACAKS
jgi:putative Mg2+ transporter-C (MgtC) family protein